MKSCECSSGQAKLQSCKAGVENAEQPGTEGLMLSGFVWGQGPKAGRSAGRLLEKRMQKRAGRELRQWSWRGGQGGVLCPCRRRPG
mmetsp:Transcript_13805/g.21554  ORF Transcript_13805/g.21554 Transcript_13805/m.21554 type:complete len:86 (-) Transcript_13805:469-726(-)